MTNMRSLVETARAGDLRTVKALLADDPRLVFSKDNTYGDTPLHAAAMEGHKEVAELLLASKAEVDAKDNDGNTPLHAAAGRGCENVAELLLANKANVNARNKANATPLHVSSYYGHDRVVQLLLAKGAEVNGKDNTGRTPLRVAVSLDREVGRAGIVNLLRRHGGRE